MITDTCIGRRVLAYLGTEHEVRAPTGISGPFVDGPGWMGADDKHDAWVMASLAHDVGLPYSPPMGTRDFMLIRAIGPECWGMMDRLENHWWDEYV